MVRGFIKKQEVGFVYERLRKKYPPLVAAGEISCPGLRVQAEA